jgi:hypothetical protein
LAAVADARYNAISGHDRLMQSSTFPSVSDSAVARSMLLLSERTDADRRLFLRLLRDSEPAFLAACRDLAQA